MRWRPFTWLLLSLLFFVAAAFFWRLGDEWEAKRAAPASSQATNQSLPIKPPGKPSAFETRIHLLAQPGNLNAPPASPSAITDHTNRFAHRLSNSTKTLDQLIRSDKGIILQNALIDTERPAPAIPKHLRAQGDPGSYIVQSRRPPDDVFRATLNEAGAQIVSTI